MSFIIDTHCHLSGEYDVDELYSIFENSKISGVKIIFDVGYDMETNNKITSNILEYNNLYGIIGIHPDNLKKIKDNDLVQLEKMASSNKKIIAIGEIGLDYYHMNSSKNIQVDFFIKQIKIAKKLNLPISIHLRDHLNKYDAYNDCYEILKKQNISKGILHCYSGNYEYANKFISLGLYISFSGIVTFKNATLMQEVAKKIDLRRMLVETDAPYLAPDPYRGTKNVPMYINYTVNKIAKLRSISREELISELHKNTFKLFEHKLSH